MTKHDAESDTFSCPLEPTLVAVVHAAISGVCWQHGNVCADHLLSWFTVALSCKPHGQDPAWNGNQVTGRPCLHNVRCMVQFGEGINVGAACMHACRACSSSPDSPPSM